VIKKSIEQNLNQPRSNFQDTFIHEQFPDQLIQEADRRLCLERFGGQAYRSSVMQLLLQGSCGGKSHNENQRQFATNSIFAIIYTYKKAEQIKGHLVQKETIKGFTGITRQNPVAADY